MPTYYFFDSSAFVKHYHAETGTAEVDRLFTGADVVILLSRLGVVETQSAFARKVREGHLTPEAFALTCTRLLNDARARHFLILPLTEAHYQRAEGLIKTYGPDKNFRRLRSLDALQLAVALDSRDRGRLNWFVAADGPLCKVAEAERLSIINPDPPKDS